jgi:hypothetical protein
VAYANAFGISLIISIIAGEEQSNPAEQDFFLGITGANGAAAGRASY